MQALPEYEIDSQKLPESERSMYLNINPSNISRSSSNSHRNSASKSSCSYMTPELEIRCLLNRNWRALNEKSECDEVVLKYKNDAKYVPVRQELYPFSFEALVPTSVINALYHAM